MAKKVADGLPPGFTSVAVSGSFGQQHDFSKNPTLQGKCKKIETISFKDGNKTKKTQVMTVDVNGTEVMLWHSYGVSGLFDKKTLGKQIYVHYDGKKKLKGGRTLKLFTCGVK